MKTRFFFLFCMDFLSKLNVSVSFTNYYLLWRTQDLADLEYGIHFTGSWEQRPECVKLSHDAADRPLVYG